MTLVVVSLARPAQVVGAFGCAVLAAAALSACGGSSSASDIQSVTSSSPVSSAAPTTSSPVAVSPVVAAQQGAVAIVRKYFTTIDELYSSPKSSFSLIDTTTTGAQAGIDRANVASDRVKLVHQTGRQTLVSVTAGAVTLVNKPQNKPNAVFPAVKVTTCNDVSAVNFVNSQGKSTVVAGRKKYLVNTLTVVNIAYPAAGSWRVSTITNVEASACPQ